MLWFCLPLLLLIALGTTINRTAAITRGSLLFDPVRPTLPPSVLPDVDRFNETFVQNRFLTLLHIIPGSIFLAAALVQFSPHIRKHHIAVHRWIGRTTILIALISGGSGLLLAIPFLFSGIAGTAAVTVFGLFFLIALLNTFAAIRRKEVQKHREWAIRAFSVGIGISVVRIVGGAMIWFAPVPTFELLGLSFWIGWLISVGAGEMYINHTRVRMHNLSVLQEVKS